MWSSWIVVTAAKCSSIRHVCGVVFYRVFGVRPLTCLSSKLLLPHPGPSLLCFRVGHCVEESRPVFLMFCSYIESVENPLVLESLVFCHRKRSSVSVTFSLWWGGRQHGNIMFFSVYSEDSELWTLNCWTDAVSYCNLLLLTGTKYFVLSSRLQLSCSAAEV